jgi:hypothetical protein
MSERRVEENQNSGAPERLLRSCVSTLFGIGLGRANIEVGLGMENMSVEQCQAFSTPSMACAAARE